MKLEEKLSLKIFSLLGNFYLLFCIFIMTEFFVLSKFSSFINFIKLLNLEFIFPSLEIVCNIFSIFLVLNLIVLGLSIFEIFSKSIKRPLYNFQLSPILFYSGFLFNCTFSLLFIYFIFTF